MDSSYFREIIRTVTVSYRVPFIFAGLLAVFFFSFTGASVLHEPMNWIFAAAGIIAFLVAVGIARYGVVWRPDLLRSERHSLATRVIDLLDDGYWYGNASGHGEDHRWFHGRERAKEGIAQFATGLRL